MSRVLVIDDDPSVTRLLEEHLSNEGYDVACVHLAEEGFKRAIQQPPELIFLDVMLPDATGFQILGRFRQHPVTRAIPIIMMTGTARFTNQQEIGKFMGANEYVLKPFNILEIGDRVRRLIQLGHKGPLPQPVDNAAPEGARAPVMEEPPIMDASAEESPTVSEQPPAPGRPDGYDEIVKLIRLDVMPHDESTALQPEELKMEPPAESGPAPQPETPEVLPTPEAVPAADAPAALPPDEAEMPDAGSTPEPIAPAQERPVRLYWTAALFTGHLAMAGAAVETGRLQTITAVASGWALLLGLLAAVSALLRIDLNSRKALRLLGWASIPLVLRAAASLAGFGPASAPQAIAAGIYWLRPLDVFELTAGVILGLSLRRQPGGSTAKCLAAVVLIAMALILAGRGYFQPY